MTGSNDLEHVRSILRAIQAAGGEDAARLPPRAAEMLTELLEHSDEDVESYLTLDLERAIQV